MAARVGYFSVILAAFLAGLSSAQDPTQELTCVCVWYYLCAEGTVNTDGTGIINPRSSFQRPTPCKEVGQLCCPFAQMSNSTSSDVAPIQESTTPSVQENETDETTTSPDSMPSDRRNLTETTSKKPDEVDYKPSNIVIEDIPKPVAHPVIVPRPGCGVKRITFQKRISFSSLDESIAQYAEFPWMLAILTEENSTVKFHCGASLIHRQVALTAAHCIESLPVETLRVRAGEWNINSTEEPKPHQDGQVSRIEVHPFYDRARLRHDVALIFLESPFNLTENVDTICLPYPGDLFHGVNCTVTGWGKDPKSTHGTFNNILHKVDVPVIPCAECEKRLRRTKLGLAFKLHASFMCAGGEPDKDSCKGDGGGPLICPTDEENRYVQAGIVSWGIGCGTTNPGVYTDVSVHSGWISRAIDHFEYILANPHRLPSNPLSHFPQYPQSHVPHYPQHHVPSHPQNHVPNYPYNHYRYPNHQDFPHFEPY